MRLCALATMEWPRIEAAYYNIDLLKVSPRKFVNLVFAWWLEHIDPAKYEERMQDLQEPLPWQDSTSLAAEEIESDSFLALMAAQEGN